MAGPSCVWPPDVLPPSIRPCPVSQFGPEPGRLSKLRLTIASPRLSVSSLAGCAVLAC